MSEPVSFAALGLDERLLRALAEVGYETPSPIQQACIPPLLEGHDLLGEAQTGTGKTAAFALPLLARLDLQRLEPQLLVLTPTRELSIQVAEALQRYAKHLPGFHVLPVYGGQSYSLQLRPLRRGVHAVVGTPGRIMDHIERGTLKLDTLRALVLDEADEMLRMGFIEAVEWILEHTPAERQTALFSATMAEPIRRVARTHLREPVEVKIRAATRTVASVSQYFWQASGMHKLDALTRILEADEALDAALVFVRTKTATAELAERLEARGHAAAALNGDMSQALRERVIEQLKGGELDIVVATDVAARGIDVARVSHVINYDIPYDIEAYVHRIGRTGRAGRSGTAILFVAPREMRMLRTIERVTRQPIEPLRLPSMEAVTSRRISGFRKRVEAVLEEVSLEFYTDVLANLQQECAEDPARIAAALLFLAQQDKPLLPAGREPSQRSGPREEPAGDARPPTPKAKPARAGRAPVPEPTELSDKPAVYRIAVGHAHEATPREIVGAIANESGIGSSHIGRIELREDYSLVELPENLPRALLSVLAKTRVRQTPLAIRVATDDDMAKPPRAPRERNRPTKREREDTSERAASGGRDGFSPPKRAAPKPHRKGKSNKR